MNYDSKPRIKKEILPLIKDNVRNLAHEMKCKWKKIREKTWTLYRYQCRSEKEIEL